MGQGVALPFDRLERAGQRVALTFNLVERAVQLVPLPFGRPQRAGLSVPLPFDLDQFVSATPAVLPLVFGLPLYAVAFSILNGIVLYIRISAENAALKGASDTVQRRG